jgi:thioredoxin reductase (NADPH)
MNSHVHDCVVIGGGPAGLSAAIYMGRFLRDTLVIDNGSGRSSFSQVNDNYLGFPKGVAVRELRDLGRKQAERFGVQFVDATVEKLESCRPTEGPTDSQVAAVGQDLSPGEVEAEFHTSDRDFVIHTTVGKVHARTVILCTGVCDEWPDIPRVEEYVGRDLFWCITCDGFRSHNKRIILYGRNDDAASTACQFNLYTKEVKFVVPLGGLDCAEERLAALNNNAIELIEGEPDRIEGEPGQMKGLVLKDGTLVEGEIMFSLLSIKPNNQLALGVGVHCDREGYVIVDEEGYTSMPGIFAAGDLSKMHTHQVVSAVHEGAEAAQTANYYLYADYQKVTLDPEKEHSPTGKVV